MTTKKNEAAEANKETVMSMEEMQAQIAAMLAEAKAEAQKIVAEAKKASGELTDAEKAAKKARAAAHKAYMEELVEVKLFRDNDKYKDDVYVGVNGENVVIKRGERVRVKRKFAEVLENSDRQDTETFEMIEDEANQLRRAQGADLI